MGREGCPLLSVGTQSPEVFTVMLRKRQEEVSIFLVTRWNEVNLGLQSE